MSSTARISEYAKVVREFWRETATARDFANLMRIRLSKSKLGWLACPSPITKSVDIPSLGGPVWLRSHTTDISVVAELIVSKGYDGLERLPTAPATILDLGANIGLVSRWLLEQFPDARIVAVEPEPGNAEIARRNLARFGEQVTVVEACVGAERRTARLHSSTGEFGFTMVGDAEPGEAIDVPVVTVEDILGTGGFDSIDLLKCDIEGAEQELFEAGGDWIDHIGLLVIECHGAFTVAELQRVLDARGSSFKLLDYEPNPQFGCEVGVLRPVA